MKNVQIRLTEEQFNLFSRRWKKAKYRNLQDAGCSALMAVGTAKDPGYHHSMVNVILAAKVPAVEVLLTKTLQLLEELSRGGK